MILDPLSTVDTRSSKPRASGDDPGADFGSTEIAR